MHLQLSKKRLTKIITIILCVVTIGIGIWLFTKPPSIPNGFSYGNGRLESTETSVSSKIKGKLVEVRYREGEDLKAGEIAAILDAEDVKAQLHVAEANLIQARETARESRENLKTAQIQKNLALVTYKRTEELIQKNFISVAQLDKDKSSLQTANANLASAYNRINVADAAVKAAMAQVDESKSNLDDSILRSPIDGRVLYRLAEPGEVVSPGDRVLAMLDLSDVYIYIYLNTQDSGKVAIGDEAKIVLDALPDIQIPAHVTFVSPKNQFTPKEVETKEERIKFMFRVKLKVDPSWLEKNRNIAKPGMPGIGWVRTDPQVTWPEKLPQPSR